MQPISPLKGRGKVEGGPTGSEQETPRLKKYTLWHSVSHTIFVMHFFHVSPTIGLIQRLLCSLFGSQNL